MSAAPSNVEPEQFRSWKARLLLVSGSILVFCLLCEAGLRISNVVRRQMASEATGTGGQFWAAYDPDLGYRLNAGWKDINADGFRDHPVGKKIGPRLLFLGDSVGYYGDNVDDTLVGHMRTALHQNAAYSGLDVINGCVPGYTNYQELGFLKKYGLKHEPDFVGVEFCLNDLHRVLHSFAMKNGQLVPNTFQNSDEIVKQQGFLRRLAGHSELALWLKEKLAIVRSAGQVQANKGYVFDYNLDFSNAWKDGAWNDIAGQMGELVELGQKNHFRVFVVGFPLSHQYRPDYLARDRSYVLKPQRKLAEICEKLKIPFYDIYPDLNFKLFDADTIHLTPEGRRVAGGLIARFVDRERIISSEMASSNAASTK
jgi:lysophospholipase L1-like esterase